MFFTLFAKNKIKTFETHITVNNETNIQIANIKPNHLIKFIQNINSIKDTINHVIFESQIADQDFSNHVWVAFTISLVFCNSLFTLSNISILASIAIQIESIRPATEARVNVTHKSFITVKTTNIYINNEIEAANQANL